MNDGGIAQVVTGLITIVGMVIGFLTMWIKLKYASGKAIEAVIKASEVEKKLDDNTTITKSVNDKADTIVNQTNGSLDEVRHMVATIAERVEKLEEYNHTSAHWVLDAINAVHLKVTELAAIQKAAIAATDLNALNELKDRLKKP